MSTFLQGIRLSGFRSFGAAPTVVAPFAKINLFIGKNNSGKSNLLRACQLAPYAYAGALPTVDDDLHDGASQVSLEVLIPNELVANSVLVKAIENMDAGGARSLLEQSVWFGATKEKGAKQGEVSENLSSLLRQHFRGRLLHLARSTQLGSYSGDDDPLSRELLRVDKWSSLIRIPFAVELPDYRQIGREQQNQASRFGADTVRLDGRTLIWDLFKLQHPMHSDIERLPKKKRFEQIRGFIADILNEPSVEIEVPFDSSQLLVTVAGRTHPIEAFGTGIHQVVMLASLVTEYDDRIVTIEEPELYLHPELQRKFLHYIAAQTSNQYFITTHSNVLIDAPGVQLFHVEYSGASNVTCVHSHTDQSNVLTALGYHASDLLQANAVIWVEGPSDRVYLRKWITAMDEACRPKDSPALRDGIHYTVMFYGGSLITYLSCDPESNASDEEFEEIIRLLPLNRHTSMVADSDRDSEAAVLKPNHQRLAEEVTKAGGLFWSTAGREIENYVNPQLYLKAMASVHKNRTDLPKQLSRFARISCGTGSKHRPLSKVAIADWVSRQDVCWEMLDLRERVFDLVQWLRAKNGLPSLQLDGDQ